MVNIQSLINTVILTNLRPNHTIQASVFKMNCSACTIVVILPNYKKIETGRELIKIK